MPSGGREVPPRDRRDIVCLICGRKGHAAGECRQPKVDKSKRPCFECGEKGHEAKVCPKKRAPIKALEATSAAGPKEGAAIFCVQIAEPRRHRQQQPNLGDFVAAKAQDKQQNSNRFQPLTLEDLAGAAASELATAPSKSSELTVDTGVLPLSGGVCKELNAKKSSVDHFEDFGDRCDFDGAPGATKYSLFQSKCGH